MNSIHVPRSGKGATICTQPESLELQCMPMKQKGYGRFIGSNACLNDALLMHYSMSCVGGSDALLWGKVIHQNRMPYLKAMQRVHFFVHCFIVEATH